MMTIEHLINSVLRFLCVAFMIITKSVDKKNHTYIQEINCNLQFFHSA